MTSRNIAEAPDPEALGQKLNEILGSWEEAPLEDGLAERFGAYAVLLMRWNARMNLTAVRDADGILRRHMAESVVCARLLPAGVETLLDFGSGAGFPGIPIAMCRPEIEVTLAESQGKKAAFLREAVRTLGLTVRVHSRRVEELKERFGCVTLRAVDRMHEAMRVAKVLLGGGGWLAALTTDWDQEGVESAAGAGFRWEVLKMSCSQGRILLLGQKS